MVDVARSQSAPVETADSRPGVRLLEVDELRLAALFEPYVVEAAALSPDGAHVAYSLRHDGNLYALILRLEDRSLRTRVLVGSDRAATGMLQQGRSSLEPARVRWFGWANDRRLLVETNHAFAAPAEIGWGSTVTGAIWGVDVDATQAVALVSPRDLAVPSGSPSLVPRVTGASGWAGRTWSVDQPVSASNLSPFDQIGREADLAAERQRQGAPPESPTQIATTFTYESLHLFDVGPDDGTRVLVMTGSPTDFTLHALDATSGKITVVLRDAVDASRLPLLDRQGNARGAVPGTTTHSWPFRYEFAQTGGLLRWKALDALSPDGVDRFFRFSPETFDTARSIPIAFDENSDVLYYASNIGRDTFGLYSLNLKTGIAGGFTIENPRVDLVTPPWGGFGGGDVLVFDRYSRKLTGVRVPEAVPTTRWIDGELNAAQALLQGRFPGRRVTLLEWSRDRARLLVEVAGFGDPGTFYVFERTSGQLIEFARRNERAVGAQAARTLVVTVGERSGVPISAIVTLPGPAWPRPAAVAMVFGREPFSRVSAAFDPEVQALTEMGMAVIQLNGRGASGFGLKQRLALKEGYDDAQVADAVLAINYLKKYIPLPWRRVVAMGRQWGGLVALRAVQTKPAVFRSAVVWEPIIDVKQWVDEALGADTAPAPALMRPWYGDEARLKAAPLRSYPELFKRPVQIWSYPGFAGERPPVGHLASRRFAESIRDAGGVAAFEETPFEARENRPRGKAALYHRMLEFLNERLFAFEVINGEAEVVDEPQAKDEPGARK